MRLGARVQTSAWARLPTEELLQIIRTHMMNREITPGRKKSPQQCPLYTVAVSDALIRSINVVGCAGVS